MKKNILLAHNGHEIRKGATYYNRERILLADDNIQLLAMLTKFLTSHGYRVTSVSNGSLVHEMLLVRDFDLIILDICMPKMNGMETVKAIREHDPYTYILLISGEAKSQEIQESLDNGADEFLAKPFLLDELSNKIGNIDFAAIADNKKSKREEKKREILKGHGLFRRIIESWRIKGICSICITCLMFLH